MFVGGVVAVAQLVPFHLLKTFVAVEEVVVAAAAAALLLELGSAPRGGVVETAVPVHLFGRLNLVRRLCVLALVGRS